MFNCLGLQMPDILYAIIESYRSAIDTFALRRLSLARSDAESSILQLFYVPKEVCRPLALIERPPDGLERPIGQRYPNRPVVVVELLLEVVLACVCDALEPGNLYVV